MAGEGLVSPYVWQYLSDPQSLRPPAFGFWMPLASFLVAASLGVFGDGVVAALLPSILGVAALTALGYALAFRLTGDRTRALLAAALIPLHPWVVRWGLSSQAALASAVFGAACLWMAVSARGRSPAWLAAAGACAGLAALSRGDGVLVLGCALLAVAVRAWRNAAQPRRAALEFATGSAALCAGFLLVMTPWYLRNAAVFGSFSPPGASKALFIRTPEDLYSVTSLDLRGYLELVLQAPARELFQRAIAVSRLVNNTIQDFALLIPLGVLGCISCWRARTAAPLAAGLGYLVVLIAFYGGIATEIGEASAHKSGLLSLPFWAGAVAAGAGAIGDRRQRLAVLAVGLCAFGVLGARSALKQKLRRSVDYTWIAESIGDAEPVLMSRTPWLVYELLGWPSLQTPNDRLDVIVEVGRRFGATHLHVANATRRPALREIYLGTRLDPRLELAAEHGTEKLYRLRYDGPPP